MDKLIVKLAAGMDEINEILNKIEGNLGLKVENPTHDE